MLPRISWNPTLEGGSEQGSERLPGRPIPGLTLQGSIIVKQVRSKRDGHLCVLAHYRRKVTE